MMCKGSIILDAVKCGMHCVVPKRFFSDINFRFSAGMLQPFVSTLESVFFHEP